MNSLEERIRELPPDLQREVEDFVAFLASRDRSKPRGRFTFEWAGTLSHLRDQYTSVELQHLASKWMSGEE